MKNKNNIKYVYGFMALAMVAILATAGTASAQTTPAPTTQGGWGGRGGMGHHMGTMRPGVFGKVTAVSGDIITVAGKTGFGTSATDVTYTVDATNATITKTSATATIADIAVGDMIAAQGTLTGTNLVATTVHDGLMQRMHGAPGTMGAGANALSNVVGNGQPVVAGSVTSISGETINITNKSNVSYTVDATNAKITKDNTTIALSSVAVGDMVIAQGTVNGNAVVASNIIDQAQPATTTTTGQPAHKGFFGSIGSFFARIFGF